MASECILVVKSNENIYNQNNNVHAYWIIGHVHAYITSLHEHELADSQFNNMLILKLS